MKKLILILPLLPLLSGCAGYGTITRNLSKDGAIVRMVTPYGTFLRIGSTTNQVRVTADGQVIINEHLTAPAPAPAIRPQAMNSDELPKTTPLPYWNGGTPVVVDNFGNTYPLSNAIN